MKVDIAKNFNFLLFFVFSSIAHSQTSTNITWLSTQINKDVGKDWSISFKPIERFNLDARDHINFSIDVFAKKKINKVFSFQTLFRHFFIPEPRSDRSFQFLDFTHQVPFNQFTLKNTLRYHIAYDFNFEDPDLLRWLPRLIYHSTEKLNVFIGIDWFYQLYGDSRSRQVRFQVGGKYKCSKLYAIDLQYWRQNQINTNPSNNFNMIVLNLVRNL